MKKAYASIAKFEAEVEAEMAADVDTQEVFNLFQKAQEIDEVCVWFKVKLDQEKDTYGLSHASRVRLHLMRHNLAAEASKLVEEAEHLFSAAKIKAKKYALYAKSAPSSKVNKIQAADKAFQIFQALKNLSDQLDELEMRTLMDNPDDAIKSAKAAFDASIQEVNNAAAYLKVANEALAAKATRETINAADSATYVYDETNKDAKAAHELYSKVANVE